MNTRLFAFALSAVSLACLLPTPTASAQNLYGIGVTQAPRYLGSADERALAVPLANFEGDRFLAKTLRGAPELGVFVVRRDGFDLAVIASIDRGRKSSDSDLLSDLGIEDIDPYVSIGITASQEGRIGPLPYNLLVRPLRRLGDSDGWLVDARASVGVVQTQRLSAQLHAQLTWADATAQMIDFEVPASAEVPFSPYQATSGVRERRFGLSAEYRLGTRTRLLAQLERRELASALRESPIVDERRATAITVGLAFQL